MGNKAEKAGVCLPFPQETSVSAGSLLFLWSYFCNYLFAAFLLVFHRYLITHFHVLAQGTLLTIEAASSFSLCSVKGPPDAFKLARVRFSALEWTSRGRYQNSALCPV